MIIVITKQVTLHKKVQFCKFRRVLNLKNYNFVSFDESKIIWWSSSKDEPNEFPVSNKNCFLGGSRRKLEPKKKHTKRQTDKKINRQINKQTNK